MVNTPLLNTSSTPFVTSNSDGPNPIQNTDSMLSRLTEDFLQISLSCPITLQIMREPWVATDGYTYERSAAQAHIKEQGSSAISPMKRTPGFKLLVEDQKIKSLICQVHPVVHVTKRYPGGAVYEGDWRFDMRHGKGKLTFNNGSTYQGEFKCDQPHGKGIDRYANGTRYDGEFEAGKRHGKGKLVLPDDYTYEGQFHQGQLKGEGKIQYKDGYEYIGQFDKDAPNGKGESTDDQGLMQQGTFKNGQLIKGVIIKPLQNGFTLETQVVNKYKLTEVTIKYTDGSQYKGNVRDDQPNGYGTLTDAFGVTYQGSFSGGALKNGTSIKKLPNGKVIKYKFVNFARFSDAEITYRSGSSYKGKEKNDLPDGRGKMIYQDGVNTITHTGMFRKGEPFEMGEATKILRGSTTVSTGNFRGRDLFNGSIQKTLRNGKVITTEVIAKRKQTNVGIEYKSGANYKGEISKDDLPHGRGTMNYADGKMYEGDFRGGERDGQGRLVTSDGNIYEGRFKNDKPHGYGIEIYENGVTYKGNFVNGKRTDGLMCFPDGSTEQIG